MARFHSLDIPAPPLITDGIGAGQRPPNCCVRGNSIKLLRSPRLPAACNLSHLAVQFIVLIWGASRSLVTRTVLV
jgi:hypothetical protein